jgi:hypothetical protein
MGKAHRKNRKTRKDRVSQTRKDRVSQTRKDRVSQTRKDRVSQKTRKNREKGKTAATS